MPQALSALEKPVSGISIVCFSPSCSATHLSIITLVMLHQVKDTFSFAAVLVEIAVPTRNVFKFPALQSVIVLYWVSFARYSIVACH